MEDSFGPKCRSCKSLKEKQQQTVAAMEDVASQNHKGLPRQGAEIAANQHLQGSPYAFNSQTTCYNDFFTTAWEYTLIFHWTAALLGQTLSSMKGSAKPVLSKKTLQSSLADKEELGLPTALRLYKREGTKVTVSTPGESVSNHSPTPAAHHLLLSSSVPSVLLNSLRIT